MKKVMKILTTIIVIILMISLFTVSYGFDVSELTGNQTDVTALKDAGNSVIKVITTIGIVVSVVALIILGIKYLMGSVEERADYKKTLVPYLIGAIFVFGASTIAQVIYEVAINF